MKILISGVSGFIGSALAPFLSTHGHEVKKLVRKQDHLAVDEISWDPNQQKLDPNLIEGFDAIINLAGENVAGRWTEKKKKNILESRVKATLTLTKAIQALRQPPQVFINASAVGYYGNAGDRLLTEESPSGNDFLAKVCKEWEEAAKPIASKNVRLVFTRFGTVLNPKGGALAKMLIPFKLGLGGVIGSGQQYMSWITLDELLGVIYFILVNKSLEGAVNVVAPQAVTNEYFTKTLGKVLSRPTFLPMPAVIARLIFGEMADGLLLTSQRAVPEKLLKAGYQFCQPDLGKALQQVVS